LEDSVSGWVLEGDVLRHRLEILVSDLTACTELSAQKPDQVCSGSRGLSVESGSFDRQTTASVLDRRTLTPARAGRESSNSLSTMTIEAELSLSSNESRPPNLVSFGVSATIAGSVLPTRTVGCLAISCIPGSGYLLQRFVEARQPGRRILLGMSR